MAATDCRDRVYALLAVSNFTNAPATLVADYTKTHAQLSVEATAFIIREAFHIYMSRQLWRRPVLPQINLDGLPSWAPTLGTLGTWDNFQDRGSPLDAQRALSTFSSRGSVASFSNNLRLLHTVSCFMGVVIPQANGGFITDPGYSGNLSPHRVSVPEGRTYVLAALFGIRAPFVVEKVSLDQPMYRIVGFSSLDAGDLPIANYFRYWIFGIKEEGLGTDEDYFAEDEREELVAITLV
jgi:hypothetical protein